MTGFSLGGWHAEGETGSRWPERENHSQRAMFPTWWDLGSTSEGVPVSQGGNGLPGEALNCPWGLASRGQTDSGADGGPSSGWGLASGDWAPFGLRAPAQQRPEESGAELAQPDTPAGLTEPLPQPHLEEGLAR